LILKGKRKRKGCDEVNFPSLLFAAKGRFVGCFHMHVVFNLHKQPTKEVKVREKERKEWCG